MSSASLWAALDLGTSSIKCLAAAADAPQVHVVGRVETPVLRPGPGRAEIDPAGVVDAALALLAKLHQWAQQRHGAVTSLALTGHISSIICLDAHGNPVPPCPIWQDQRCGREADLFIEAFGGTRSEELLGINLPRGANWPGPKLRWMREHCPEVPRDAWKIVQLRDYLFLRLTDQVWSDPASQLGLCHLRRREYAEPIIEWCGIRENQLPELHQPAERALMGADVAARLFSGQRPWVVLGTADMAASFRGCAPQPGDGLLMANSAELTGVAVASTHAGATPAGVVRYPLTEETDLIYGVTSNGGASLQWLEEVAGPVDRAQLAAEAEQVTAGCDGLLFMPYLTGERAPLWDPRLAGAMLGLRAVHTKAHLYRAVLEGCTFSKRHVQDTIASGGVPRPAVMKVAGGSANHPLWNRIRASVLGVPLSLLPCSEASGLGALALAAQYDDPGAIRRWLPDHAWRRVEPEPAWVAAYEPIYQRYRQAVEWVKRAP